MAIVVVKLVISLLSLYHKNVVLSRELGSILAVQFRVNESLAIT